MRAKLFILAIATIVAGLTGWPSPATCLAESSVEVRDASNNEGSARPRGNKQTKSRLMKLNSALDCIKRLKELANKDVLPAYEGEPEKIINDRLLWHRGENRCAVDQMDQKLRMEIFNVALAWRMGNAQNVRRLLEEVERDVRAASVIQNIGRTRAIVEIK